MNTLSPMIDQRRFPELDALLLFRSDHIGNVQEQIVGGIACRQEPLLGLSIDLPTRRALGRALLPLLEPVIRTELRLAAEKVLRSVIGGAVATLERDLLSPTVVTPMEPVIVGFVPVNLQGRWIRMREAGLAGDEDARRRCGIFLEAVKGALRLGDLVENPQLVGAPGYGVLPRFPALVEVLKGWRPEGKRREPTRRPWADPRTKCLPATLAQQTWPEIRTVGAAFGDAPAMRRWRQVEGEVALLHQIQDWPLQTLLSLELGDGKALNWWGLPPTAESLREEMRQMDLDGVFLLNVLIGLALREGQVTVSIHDLIHAIGRGKEARRSQNRRRQIARMVWRAVLLFDSISVVGCRPGTYRTRDKQVIDVGSHAVEALIRVTGRDWGQVSTDRSEPPELLSYVCGPWIERMRGNDRVLPYFGDVLKIAAIPSGQATGRWAKSIGLNLNQIWRERSSDALITRPGDDNRLSVSLSEPLTRRDLLIGDRYFRANPDADDLLTSADPGRVRAYWDGAVAELKQIGQIGLYRYVSADAGRKPGLSRRQGWQSAWLDEPLDIRPTTEWAMDMEEIARGKKAAKAARRRSPSRAPR